MPTDELVYLYKRLCYEAYYSVDVPERYGDGRLICRVKINNAKQALLDAGLAVETVRQLEIEEDKCIFQKNS